jgi:hypothetical protein
VLIIQHKIQYPSLDFEVQNEEEKIPQCRNGSKTRIEKYYRKGKLDTLLHKHMTTQYQNTIPLRRKQFSSSMVLYGNHLNESIVNKPLSFLSHCFPRSSSDHSCHTYSRKGKTHFSIMSVNRVQFLCCDLRCEQRTLPVYGHNREMRFSFS